MDSETIIVTVTFAVMGIGFIILGRLGIAGKLDFSLGTYTRATTTPQSWAEAHRIMGRSLIQSGWVQIAGTIAVAIFGLKTTPGTAGFTLSLLGSLAPVLAIWPTFRVLERLDESAES